MSDVALKYQNASLLPWQPRGRLNFQKTLFDFLEIPTAAHYKS